MAKSTPPAKAAPSRHAAPLDPGDALFDGMVRLQAYFQTHWLRIALIAAGIVAAAALVIGLGESRVGRQQEAADALSAAMEADSDATRLDALASVVEAYPATGAALQAAFAGAELAFEREDYARARALYGQIYDAQPESALAPAALMGLGAALEAEGDPVAAQTHYERVLDARPATYARVQAQVALARLAEADGRANEALALYRAIVTDAPGSAWGRHATRRIADLAPAVDALAATAPAPPATDQP